jgi:pyruvate decarboxylase
MDVAFAERVPVIHVVGTPPTEQMKAKPLLHHTLGNGHFEAYSKAAEHFVVASAILSEPPTAGAEIDRVLVDCVTKVAQRDTVSRDLPSNSFHLVSPRLYHTSDGFGWRNHFRGAAPDAP